MFNFIVTGQDITSRGSIAVDQSRLMLYTDEQLKNRFAPLGQLDTEALQGLPCIFANESSSDRDFPMFARVARITSIRCSSYQITVDYEVEEGFAPIPNSDLEALAQRLHFDLKPQRGFGDFHTNHWAIKGPDLFRELYRANLGQIKPTVFKLPGTPADPKLVSVMMPFDAGFNPTYAALKEAIEQCGMRCSRADDIWQEETVIQDVVNLIASARIVICDLSNKNANVFYEAGIAHTLGRPVILLARHDSEVPFDVQHIRYVKYLPNAEGLAAMAKSVKDRIEALVETQ